MLLRIELVYYQVLAEFSPTTPQTRDNPSVTANRLEYMEKDTNAQEIDFDSD